MAEIVSRQAASIAAGTKLTAANMGKVVMVVITSPAAAAWAQNDTIASGMRIPIGARPLAGGFVSCAAMGAGVTLDVGLRNYSTGVAVDADGIASAIDVSGATVAAINDGALVAAGVESVTTVETELYATLGGGNPTDDAQIRIEVPFLFP